MNKEEHFQKQWERFMDAKSHPCPERIDGKELARMFYEFGFSKGVFG